MKLFLRFENYLWGLFGLLLVVFGFVLFNETFENWICALLDLPRKNEVLKFLGFGMGGTLFVLQVLASNKRAKAMEDAAKAQAGANLHTETGHRQERLKNAIEHLGHESDSVRLGGAYELLHLARDTKEYPRTVLEILCAHIRSTTGETKYQQAYKSKPSEEIQSLLTLLFVRQNEIFSGLHADLRGSFLNGAFLPRARLNNALLNEAIMQKAVLIRAYLQGARLVKTNLESAYLGSARMHGALLVKTSFKNANLVQAHLQGAIILKIQLLGAKLDRAQLQGVKKASSTKLKSSYSYEFSNLIRESIGQESDLSGVIPMEGGVESIVKDSGAITGSYSKEEAEGWIAEYDRTTSKTPIKSARTGDGS